MGHAEVPGNNDAIYIGISLCIALEHLQRWSPSYGNCKNKPVPQRDPGGAVMTTWLLIRLRTGSRGWARAILLSDSQIRVMNSQSSLRSHRHSPYRLTMAFGYTAALHAADTAKRVPQRERCKA